MSKKHEIWELRNWLLLNRETVTPLQYVARLDEYANKLKDYWYGVSLERLHGEQADLLGRMHAEKLPDLDDWFLSEDWF